MELRNVRAHGSGGYTTFGTPWRRGQLAPARVANVRLASSKSPNVAAQTRVSATWPDGSVKWLAHTCRTRDLGGAVTVELGERPAMAPRQCQNVFDDGRCVTVTSGDMIVTIDRESGRLFETLTLAGCPRLMNARAEAIMRFCAADCGTEVVTRRDVTYHGRVSRVSIEEAGPLVTVVKYEGDHVSADGDHKLPFIIRLTIGLDTPRLDWQHTFIYDGDEATDFVVGVGVAVDVPMSGDPFNRHVVFAGDDEQIHESLAHLLTWRPPVPRHIYTAQMAGLRLTWPDEAASGDDSEYVLTSDEAKTVATVMSDMPIWDEYRCCQDSADHFAIRKKIADEGVWSLTVHEGRRSLGGAAFGSPLGAVMVAMKDFWQRYPSGYTFTGLSMATATAHIWLWSPEAAPADYRHYTTTGYQMAYYEGYNYDGSSAYGVAATSEFSLALTTGPLPDSVTLDAFIADVISAPLYIASPGDYHAAGVFGRWSLPHHSTELETWIENQLESALDFYMGEVDRRSWYGMYDFGDVMHTYDDVRHQWRYDMGGYAWDNAELVPTYWLWYAFLRSSRADIFDMAARMSRHCADVDIYHLGPYARLGSRHNVRHWGCACKEARIAMAGHHRVFYYLTGDRRIGDVLAFLADAEIAFLTKDPLGDFYDRTQMVYPSHARTGPDWAALTSNWMTAWERTGEHTCRDKIASGIASIKQAPLGLLSGVDFEFDPATFRLRYINDVSTGGIHLAVCQGASQVWVELADLWDDDTWADMVARFGRVYFSTEAERDALLGPANPHRDYPFPFFAAALGAYAAERGDDEELARRVWAHLVSALADPVTHAGFATRQLSPPHAARPLVELDWAGSIVKTNFVAQWCLNAIVALDHIRHFAPATIDDALAAARELNGRSYRTA